MRAYLEGRLPQPAVAVIGVWDPFLADHEDLLRQVSCYARQHSRSSLAIVIHPAPGAYIYGTDRWPVYNDVPSRIQLIHDCGIEAILRLHFGRHDLDAVAADFFEVVLPHVRLDELWLGSRQSLGTGPEGSGEALLRVADQQGVRIKRLPEVLLKSTVKEIRRYLMAGQVAEAIRITGRPPVRRRPRPNAPERLAWAPGLYRALPLEHPTATTSGAEIEVPLIAAANGLATLQWPDRRLKYLTFVAGPGDRG